MNISLELTLRKIVETQTKLFELSPFRAPYKFQEVYLVNLLQNTSNGIIELPQKVQRASIVYRDSNNGIVERDFLYFDSTLIPLGTHFHFQKNSHLVYYLNDTGNLINQKKLSQYVLNKVPEKVVLTRVLSQDELLAWKNNGKIGSIHKNYWKKPLVHTAVESVSTEFKPNQRYSKGIEIHLSKEELRKLLFSDVAKIGTYSFLFEKRKEDSTFPFDMEISFTKTAFPLLIEGYNRFRKESGIDYTNLL